MSRYLSWYYIGTLGIAGTGRETQGRAKESRGDRMKKVSIIGSGNVGVNSAFFIAEMAAANVMLVDIKEGVSEGKALDLMEAAPIRNYRTAIEGSSDITSIAGSHAVVIAAGLIRTPGHDRGIHFKENSAIVRQLCADIVKHAPQALVIVATEPVDAMVKIALEETGFDRSRVMGIGGILDCTRMAHFVADELGLSPRDIAAMVIGSHTRYMVPVPDYTCVNGIPVTKLASPEAVSRIVEDTRNAGSVIVDLAKQASAFYAPSSAIAQVVEAVCIDTHKVLSLSVVLDGEYGMHGVALSVPCRIGAAGVEKILEVDFGEETLQAFRDSAEPVLGWF
jgi:malate dehydrogenase